MGIQKIVNWVTGKIIFQAEADKLKEALEIAVKKGVNLKGANLKGANLKGANLEGANLEGAYLEGAKGVWAYRRSPKNLFCR